MSPDVSELSWTMQETHKKETAIGLNCVNVLFYPRKKHAKKETTIGLDLYQRTFLSTSHKPHSSSDHYFGIGLAEILLDGLAFGLADAGLEFIPDGDAGFGVFPLSVSICNSIHCEPLHL